MDLFGWDAEVAEEYCRPILSQCDPQIALEHFLKIYDETRLLPAVSEIIARGHFISPQYLRATDGFCYADSTRLSPGLRCGCVKCRPAGG